MSIGNKNKSDLNILCQKSHILTASYTSAVVEGNFVSTVSVKGHEYRSTSGYPTKKEAENDAAGVALIDILRRDYSGQSFDEVISLLELKFPSKNKKKAKQGVGLSESPSQQERTTAEVIPPTYAQQTAMVHQHPQSMMVASQAGMAHFRPHPQGVATTVPSYASVSGIPATIHSQVLSSVPHQQQMVGGANVVTATHGPGPMAYSKGVLPQQVQTSVNPISASSAHYYHKGGASLPMQQQPHPHSAYAPPTQTHPGQQPHPYPAYPPPTQAHPGQQSIYAPPTGTYQQMSGGQVQVQPGIPPPTHGYVYPSPQRGVYMPGPSTPGAARMTPPPGIKVAARFSTPTHSPPPPVQPPPGFSPQQQPITNTQISPNKPLNAIPISANRQGLPAGATNQLPSINQQTEVTRPGLNHTKALEVLCERLKLSTPFYKVKESGKAQYTAEVWIGGRSYGSRWISDDFERAKTVAAMEALSRMALTMGTQSNSSTGIGGVYSETFLADKCSDGGITEQPQPRGSGAVITGQEKAPIANTNTSQSTPTSSFAPPTATPTATPTVAPNQTTGGQSTVSTQNRVLNPAQLSSETGLNQQPSTLKPPSFYAHSPNSSPTDNIEDKKLAPVMSAINYKQVLNIHCQKNHIPVAYECFASEDSVGYIATIKTSGRMFESKTHGTKKAAEIDAAEKAVKALGLCDPTSSSTVQHHQQAGFGYGGIHGTTASSSQPQSVGIVSYKNLLQEHLQKQSLSLPHYETERVESGFKSIVRVQRPGSDSLQFTSSPQPVKKAAEQEAAKLACIELNLVQ